MKRLIRLTTSLALAVAVAGFAQPSAATAAARTAPPAAAAAGEVTAAAKVPASRGYAYVWANLPTTPAYTPAAAYSHNSTGGTNTITRQGIGRYVVALPNLGTLGGTAHATAYGPTNATCQVAAWIVVASRIDLYVRCNSPAGALVDNRFTASFTNRPPNSRLGYLWADQPSAPAYAPSSTYRWNSTGGVNTVLRQGVGSYLVRLPGLGASSGHVQVTAYGTTPARCKVVNWGPSGTLQLVRVQCYGVGSVPLDTRYSLTYVDRSGPLWTTSAAYAWANAPTTANYLPSAAYRYNSTGATNTVRRLGVGNYLVSLPGQALTVGTVLVTAYGPGSHRCNVGYWNSSGVQVLCRTAAGSWADSQFDVAFQR